MVTSIFLWGVSGYIWINILTYDPWGIGRPGLNEPRVSWTNVNNFPIIHQMTPQLCTVIIWHTFYQRTKFRKQWLIKVTVLKNMTFWRESKILWICQKFCLNSKIYCKPSVTICKVLMLIKRISVIFQQGVKQVLLKHRDFIASYLEVVGNGSNEPVYCGLNKPLVGLVRFYYKHL